MEFLIYSVCFGVGLVFTLVSAFFGHLFGGHDAHVDVGTGGHAEAGFEHSGMPGISPFSPTIIASFVTAFGGFGMIFSQIEATQQRLDQRAAVDCWAGWSSPPGFCGCSGRFFTTRKAPANRTWPRCWARRPPSSRPSRQTASAKSPTCRPARVTPRRRAIEKGAAGRQRPDRQNHPHRRHAVLRRSPSEFRKTSTPKPSTL